MRWLHTSIFIETPSLDGLPTKTKEDPSPHDMRLYPAGHKPSVSWSRGGKFITIIITIIIVTSTTSTTSTTSATSATPTPTPTPTTTTTILVG